MVDERLDEQLQNINYRYQELLHSDSMQFIEKKNRYLKIIRNFNIKGLIEELRYRDYAKRNFSIKGNVDFHNNEKQDVKQFKIAVYSCIVGRYDSFIEPVYVEPEIDYLMFTDQNISSSSAWKKIDITKMKEYGRITNPMLNRKLKIQQCDLLKQYDYTIYVDGNIEIVTGLSPLISDMKSCGLGLHYHRVRDCIYDEVVAVKHRKRLYDGDIDKQIISYRNEGYPAHNGMYENSIIVRDNHCTEVEDLMLSWWEEYCKYPTRDQLSLPYIIWKKKFDKHKILILGNDIERNVRFNRINKHL